MLKELKEQVFKANLELVKYNLVIFTWGNVSARDGDYIVIKPSGVEYDKMKADDMVVLDLDGNKIDGKYNPSSDTLTHLELYKAFPNIKGITHTHSNYATSFAQAGCEIVALGTTHADYFYGAIPITRHLDEIEVVENYEKNTGKVIIEAFKGIDYMAIPGVLVRSHGVFAWGKSAGDSIHNAVVIEELAKMNYQSIQLNPDIKNFPKYILDKHYSRKHGKNAYYGQKHI
ncbi:MULTISPECIES: L-ribulose-5-phosphate 4-epimerase [Campylobacter]|uniref:L-ribulose-5-phosphate 4-epimerase n=1 Tax=Campylobacter porcelli TaxID=1660073 RepID=A0ABU7M7E7_9BACT|nr:L-ribulose-5-phosphate 4-epimerase [Campylobacter sp. P0124]MCR8697103.1 L-ribulose-5-phosphate 4-epimerase [Campylobacter sp. RM19073]MEE3705534.1 L-ribulose-5-phosphate 4-epimerase [Campylobacter sp. CX2-8023-23]MEE3745243.1 L-ribulose-5-phosphate 4-epimerase [Campylobacter sp. CX2-4855-23]